MFEIVCETQHGPVQEQINIIDCFPSFFPSPLVRPKQLTPTWLWLMSAMLMFHRANCANTRWVAAKWRTNMATHYWDSNWELKCIITPLIVTRWVVQNDRSQTDSSCSQVNVSRVSPLLASTSPKEPDKSGKSDWPNHIAGANRPENVQPTFRRPFHLANNWIKISSSFSLSYHEK